MSNKVITQKSEILFLYESSYSIPNGDPFTGEQRYDDETKKVLISDVRIKRFIRDYLFSINDDIPGDKKHEIYVWNDVSHADKEMSGASARMKSLKMKYKDNKDIFGSDGKNIDEIKLLKKCIDVRLFGGISTETGASVNLTGPVQFALLNPSLNQVDLRVHQNTSVFVSSTEKTRGAIGTTTLVPYSINQIHGWINPYSAKYTDLTEDDVNIMLKALWESINLVNTRTKNNQNSLLLLQIIYHEPTDKIYGLDRLIRIELKDNKKDEELRSLDDFNFDFSELCKIQDDDKISEIRYYTEKPEIAILFQNEFLKNESKKGKLINLKEIIFKDAK